MRGIRFDSYGETMKPPHRKTLAQARESIARETILNAAQLAARERGFAVTLAEITTGAGVSNSTLYRYYPAGREAVIERLVIACVDTASQLADAVADIDDPEEALAAWMRAGFDMVSEYGLLAVQIANGVMPEFCTDAARLDELYRFTGHLIKRWIDAGHARGDVVTADAVGFWYALVAPIRLKGIDDAAQMTELADATLELFKRAYGRSI